MSLRHVKQFRNRLSMNKTITTMFIKYINQVRYKYKKAHIQPTILKKSK